MRWESFTFPHNYTSLVKKELMTSAVQTEENRKQKREREERENEREKKRVTARERKSEVKQQVIVMSASAQQRAHCARSKGMTSPNGLTFCGCALSARPVLSQLAISSIILELDMAEKANPCLHP